MDKASRWLNTTVNVTTGSLVNVCHRPETFILFGPRLSSFHLQRRHVLCNRTRTLWFVNEMACAPKGIPQNTWLQEDGHIGRWTDKRSRACLEYLVEKRGSFKVEIKKDSSDVNGITIKPIP